MNELVMIRDPLRKVHLSIASLADTDFYGANEQENSNFFSLQSLLVVMLLDKRLMDETSPPTHHDQS